jgi:hypothetical protein
VQAKGKGVCFGAFYDPAVRPDRRGYAEGAEAEKAARAKSKRLLRLQVKDFVDWLKGQGVI